MITEISMLSVLKNTKLHLISVFLLVIVGHCFKFVLTKGSYTPFSVGPSISALVFDETQLYLPGVMRFYRESTLPSEIDIFELKDKHNGYPFAHSLLIGTLSKIVGNVELTWILFQGLSAVFIWYVLKRMLVALTSNQTIAFCGSWIILLFAFSPRHSLLMGSDALYQPIEISRTPHPSLSFLMLILASSSLWKALTCEEKSWMWMCSFFSVFLLFSYYFYWVPFLSTLFVLCVLFVGAKKVSELKITATILIATLVFSSPYFIRVILGRFEGNMNHLLARVGTFSHQAELRHILLLLCSMMLLLGFVWKTLREKKKMAPQNMAYLILLSLLAAASLGLNLQIITGYNPQHTHYFNRLIQPLVLLIAFALWETWTPGYFRKTSSTLAMMFTALLITLGVYRQWQCAVKTFQDHRNDSPIYELLLWARKHIPADKVIGSGEPSIATLIPSIAGTWSFVPVGDRTMATNREILVRYVIASQLEGLSKGQALKRMASRGPDDSRLWLHSMYLFFCTAFPDENILKETEGLWDQMNLEQELKKRKIDFLIVPVGLTSGRFDSTIFQNREFKIVGIKA